jgi:hypothetical protein
MNNRFHFCALVLLVYGYGIPIQGANYRTEKQELQVPADEISEEIAKLLSPDAVRVIRGSKTTLCEIWLCKEVAVKGDFEPTADVLYPFTPGQLIGVVRFRRKGGDFRDQDIGRGYYTMRYAHQPVDGAHVGTSLTRDFLLLIQAEHDRSAELINYDRLTESSSEAAGTSHPCMLSLQRVVGEKKSGDIRHDDQHDWWIIALEANAARQDATRSLPFELVVVGYGEE